MTEPIVKRFIRRHRLEKKNPGHAPSEAIEPIAVLHRPRRAEPVENRIDRGRSF